MLNLLREFITFGGLPEIVLAEEGLRSLIISDYLTSFVNRDIVERYGLRNTEVLTDLLRILPNTRSFAYSKLANSLKSMGHAISKSTTIRYMHWLEWSFFLSSLEVFSPNIKNRNQAIKKSYLIDNYFSTQFSSNFSVNIGHAMEQTAFHILHARRLWDPRNELFYWKDYLGNEVDFVLMQNKTIQELIQVTFASNQEDVHEREAKALIKAAKYLHQSSGRVITWDFEDDVTINNVRIIYTPLRKWLASS